MTVILAWLTLVIGFPVNVIAAVLLYRAWRRAPQLRVLRERFIVAVVTAIVVAVFGLIFINNDQAVPPLDIDATKLITRFAILGLAIIPTLVWLHIYVGRENTKRR